MGASPGRSQAAKPELDMNYFRESIHSAGTALGEEPLRIATERGCRAHPLVSLCLARYTELTVEHGG